jgi:hemin uptake protein HemP
MPDRRPSSPPPAGNPHSEDRPAPPAAYRSAAIIASETLFNGATEVQIMHNGSVYRLRQTAMGKLILTK